MTICAAAMCPDGIVLCADTLESVGSVHRSVQKLVELPLVNDDLKAMIVCATEDAVFSDALIEKISESLDRSTGTLASARDAIEDATLKYCSDVWKTVDDPKPKAEMLIGLKTIDDFRLLHLSTPTIRNIDSSEFIGYGRELAIYKASQYGLKDSPMDVTAPIVAYIVDIVKNNSQYCGRETNLALLHKDGTVEHKSQDYIAKTTQGYKSIDWLLNTWAFPFLPLFVTASGSEDALSMIGNLGVPKSDWVEKIPGILQFLAARKKSIQAGEPQPEPTEARKLGVAFAGVKLAIDMIVNQSQKIHELGAIEGTLFSSVQEIYPKASKAGQLAQEAANAGDAETAKRHIESVFKMLTQKSTARTLKGRR
jgi:hypothetical protein